MNRLTLIVGIAAAVILQPARAEPQQTRRLIIGLHLGDHLLDELMLPDFDADGRFTRAEIVLFAVVLVIITMVATLGRDTSLIYPLAMAMAGVFFLYYIGRLAIHHSRKSASRVVHASVIYLPLVLSVMIFFRP